MPRPFLFFGLLPVVFVLLWLAYEFRIQSYGRTQWLLTAITNSVFASAGLGLLYWLCSKQGWLS